MGPISALSMPGHSGASRRSPSAFARATVAAVAAALVLVPVPAFAENTADSFTPVPNPPQQSRKNGQNQAAMLAAAGAAFAGAMCLMFLKKAQEAVSESERTMYQMMAMQECKQVPESLAKAGENNQGAQTMNQQPQVPGQNAAAATSAPFQQPSQAVAQDSSPKEEAKEVPTFSPVVVPTSGVVAESAFDGTKGDDNITTKGNDKNGGVVGDATTDLKGMPQAKVGFDESSTNSNPVSTVGSVGGGVAANGGSGDGKSGPDGKNAGDNKDAAGRQAKTTADAGGEGSSGNAATGNGKPGDNLDAMLAQMMAGMHGGDAGTLAMGQTSGNISFGSGKGAAGDEELPNIFEYATFRYRELVDEDKLLFDGSIVAHKKGRTQPKVAKATEPKSKQSDDRKKPKNADESAPRGLASVGAPVAAPANPALAAARTAGTEANANDKTQAQVDARLAPSKVRMAGGLR